MVATHGREAAWSRGGGAAGNADTGLLISVLGMLKQDMCSVFKDNIYHILSPEAN